MKLILEFLKELAVNNNRDWFNANKSTYLEVKEKVESLTSSLITSLTEIEPQAALLSPADCLYRIYRDTRFSTDKTPYKTHIGIYINPRGGKKSEFCGYYVHIEPGQCLVAGGAWFPEMPLLKEYRREIYNNIEEYLEIINKPEFAARFQPYMQDPLRTVPKGYPKDWPYNDLIKPRSMVVASLMTDRQFTSPGLVNKLMDLFRILKPYNDFFNFTLEEHPDLTFRSSRK